MNNHGLLHPDFTDGLLQSFFTRRCSIQKATTIKNEIGGDEHTFADVVGLTGIPCRLMPAIGSAERQRADIEATTHYAFVVLLDDFYDGITSKNVAVIDGDVYNIGVVGADSNQTLTRLSVDLRE